MALAPEMCAIQVQEKSVILKKKPRILKKNKALRPSQTREGRWNNVIIGGNWM
jgi:hypothetical protein